MSARAPFTGSFATASRPATALAGWRLVAPLLLACLAWLGGAPARAVIIASGDGSGNTTPPPDDFGFANVGSAEQTAVYLGNGWVITANHVREGDVILQGHPYPAVPGSKLRLSNPGGGVSADLAVFRLQEPVPDLPSLTVRSTPLAPGLAVVMAGNGFDRGDPMEFEARPGWTWASAAHLRWGTNEVQQTGLTVNVGIGTATSAFSTDFTPGLPTPHEAQVAVGDSGGAAFVKQDGRWELAGVLFAADTFEGQPPRTAVYGNTTFAADLPSYRDQILERTLQPACRDGLDDDGDGRVDFPEDPDCLDADDPDELSRCPAGTLAGDANGDGRPDGLDYAIWTEHAGRDVSTPPAPQNGDFDCDGHVDATDFFLWRTAYRRQTAR